MKDYTLSQQYAIVGLDGLESLHGSTAKRAVLRGIAAAQLLEEILQEEEAAPDARAMPDERAQAAVGNDTAAAAKLEAGLKEVRKQSKRQAKELEKEMADFLTADGVLEIVPDLLACDMNYYTAGVDLKAYRSDKDIYAGIVERVRAEVLEEGPVTAECICLLWLFRESGCLHDIFSTEEQKLVQSRMVRQTAADDFYRALWQAEFHSGLESLAGSLLRAKSNLFRNPFLEGVNLLYPFLNRRQAIFIDFVILGTSVQDRRLAVLTFLTEKGHNAEEVKNGAETLLKIDNTYYRIWPKTVSCGRIPIQGAELLPVYK